MKKELPIGLDNYRMLKERNLYHVDKTLMIKEFLDDSGTWVTLITRPRRFGKTLNMSMMAEFFDITKDSYDLFKDTNIMKTEYASCMNQYPTIFISFAGAKGEDKYSVIEAIKYEIKKEYERYEFIFQDKSSYDVNDYQRHLQNLQNLNSISDINYTLPFLMKRMEAYYHKKVMLFIDEYDTPFIEAYIHDYYQDIRSGLASILRNSLKLSNNLEYAMLTGIQRVANENIFSDLNNVEIYDLSSNHFSQYFGFTEDETKQILKDYNLEFSDEVKSMYDGYHIGHNDVYNPWSILKYAKNRELGYYWVNTSSNIMIKNAMQKADISFNNGFEFLIEKGYLDTSVNLGTSFYEESETATLWGLFVNAGYLTIVEKKEFEELRIKIPDYEVVREFKSLVANYFMVSQTSLDNLVKALLKENSNDFLQSLNDILQIPSYYDYVSKNSYHMLFLSLCLYLENTHYPLSNRENGERRSDITMISKTPRYPSYVIEFKYGKEDKNDLNKLAQEAYDQIIRNNYNANIKGRIVDIGLGVHGKKVSMQWIIKE